jgi:hypothetical protein
MDEQVTDAVNSHYSGYFTKYGISPKNVFKASMYFVGLGAIYTTGLWGICFVFRPTRYIVQKLNWPKLNEKLAKVRAKADQKQGRAALALGEALVLKGVLGPVALPFKIWLAVKLVNAGQVSEPKDQQ